MYQQRLITQINESPYKVMGMRSFSRKRENTKQSQHTPQGQNDVGRRIVTDNSQMPTPSIKSNQFRKTFTRKGGCQQTNQSFQDIQQDDLQLLIGIQSVKADQSNSFINNYNNIHININHNELLDRKYFPTLKNKVMNPQRYQTNITSNDEMSIINPSSTSNKYKSVQQPSTSLHENNINKENKDKDQRSISSHIQNPKQRKLVILKKHNIQITFIQKTTESFEANQQDQQFDNKYYQNMIIAQIRDKKDFYHIQRNKSIQETKKLKIQQGLNSTKNQNLNQSVIYPKKSSLQQEQKQPTLLDQSIDLAESQKNLNLLITKTPQGKIKQHNLSLQQSHNNYVGTGNNQRTNSNLRNHTQSQSASNNNQSREREHSSTNNSKSSNQVFNTTNKESSQKISISSQEGAVQQKKAKDLQNETLQQQPSTSQEKQNQAPKKIHPKVLWDMSDEEWAMFGDRFPIQFDKKKLLGRGGFSLVWLGEHRKTKEKFAIKQILSNNTHQSHMKEIWFGSYFFENGNPKQKFQKFIGSSNLVRFLAYDVKPLDTWIFYEICGESLGNHLYDLRGENHAQERIYRIYHRSLYQALRKDNVELKRLLKDLAQVLDLLSDQRIVHSDLKTENILIKTEKTANGSYQITQTKLIDYGSSFPFDDLKQFSMATPEYMCPEILNYILFENQLEYHQSLLKYLNKYNKPWVVDIWSLGCVILEIISGIPLWMSLKTIVNKKGKDSIEYGLFAVKGRVFEKIIERQIEVVSNLDYYLDNQSFSGIQFNQQNIKYSLGVKIDNDVRYLLKRMLALDPDKRISPKEIIDYLDPQSNKILFTQ